MKPPWSPRPRLLPYFYHQVLLPCFESAESQTFPCVALDLLVCYRL